MISITRNDVNQAIADATERAHGDTKQRDRIEKSAVWLSKWGGDAWTLKSDTITIRSCSSDEVYTLTLCAEFCEHQCRSRRPCWHLTLSSLILAANEIREDRESLAYGVWFPNMDCCGGQGYSLCMVTVEPAVTLARVALAPAIITNECPEEILSW